MNSAHIPQNATEGNPALPNTEFDRIDFYGTTLVVVPGATLADTLVAMKPVVEGMGLTWQGQHEKLKTHPVLNKGIREILIPSAGGAQAMTALPLSRLNFWLATIHPTRVTNPDTKAKVIRYQSECADVLFAHFFGKATGETESETQRHLSSLDRKVAALEAKVNTAGPDASWPRKLALVREARLSGVPKPYLQALWVRLGLPSTEGMMKAAAVIPQGDLFDSRPHGSA